MTDDRETLEPATASDPEQPDAVTDASERRLWPVALAAGVVAGAVIAGLVVLAVQGGTPPPLVPTQVRAAATACAPPACEQVGSIVRLTWTPGEGATATRVLRDGVVVSGRLPATARSFLDLSAPIGSAVSYTVVADGPGGSVVSAPIAVAIPTPPVSGAGMDGRYVVRVTVRHARNLASLFGVTNPKRGSTGTTRWTFTTTCAPELGACPTTWGRSTGVLRSREGVWVGLVGGPRARCPGGGTVAAPVHMRLHAVAGTIDAGWWVRRFRGSATVRFSCPGVIRSRGRASVSGSRR